MGRFMGQCREVEWEGVLRKERKEEHWAGSPGSWHKCFLSSHPVPGLVVAQEEEEKGR